MPASSIKALVSGCSQRSSSTGVAVSSTHPSSSSTARRSSRSSTPPRCAARATPRPRRRAGGSEQRRVAAIGARPVRCRSGALHAPCRHDDDVLERGVLVALAAAGTDAGYLVDLLHAFAHAPELRVAVVARAVIEKLVVLQVDEELRGGAVDVAGARHGGRAARILQAVVRLVADRRARLPGGEVGRQAAALD